MVGVEEVFGVLAGKVWNTLKEKGNLTVGEIAKLASLSREEAMAGLGWLARENKIRIEYHGKKRHYSLNE